MGCLFTIYKENIKNKVSLTKMLFLVLFWGISLVIIWLLKETIDSIESISAIILLVYANFKQTERIDKLERLLRRMSLHS